MSAELRISTITTSVGLEGVETGKHDAQCLDVGDYFCVHETRHYPGHWTVSHKPSGFSCVSGILTIWDAVECAHAFIVAASDTELDASESDVDKLIAQPQWQAFKVQGARIRATFNSPKYKEAKPYGGTKAHDL